MATAVIPIYGRHPQALAQQALSVQAAVDNRLTLGIGMSHRVVVEDLWGYRYERPARHLRQFLEGLMPLVHGQTVRAEGDMVTTVTPGPLQVPGAAPCPVVVAALGPAMLRVTGELADGTVTWMTGVRTVAAHIVPSITAAAEAAGRPAPRVVVSLPLAVTSDEAATRARIDTAFAAYPSFPSYKAMLDREGATRPSDVALVGDEEVVAAQVAAVAEAGGTDLVASVVGSSEDRGRAMALLGSLNRP